MIQDVEFQENDGYMNWIKSVFLFFKKNVSERENLIRFRSCSHLLLLSINTIRNHSRLDFQLFSTAI